MILDDAMPVAPEGSQRDLAEFTAVFPEVVRDLTETTSRYADVRIANEWWAKVRLRLDSKINFKSFS